MKREAEVRIRKRQAAGIIEARHHVAGQPKLVVARGAQEIHLPALLADQDIGARNVGATGQVKTDKRNLAGARRRDTARAE